VDPTTVGGHERGIITNRGKRHSRRGVRDSDTGSQRRRDRRLGKGGGDERRGEGEAEGERTYEEKLRSQYM
jgi:hypothetical protein